MNEREIYFKHFYKKQFQTCPELFYKKAVLKNFEIFIGKTPAIFKTRIRRMRRTWRTWWIQRTRRIWRIRQTRRIRRIWRIWRIRILIRI